jgi:hypothetical protein
MPKPAPPAPRRVRQKPGEPGRSSPPGPPDRRTGRPLGTAARVAAAALALALATVPIVRERALVARQARMSAWLGGYGLQTPAEMEHEPDPGRVDLRAARASLAAELDPARHTDLPPTEEARQRASGAARLADTARLAGATLAERPAAWDAAMVMGAATYLSWSLARDGRLFTAAPAWERPLEAAVELAPGRDDAARLLATAYLEVWPALSPARRERGRQLLAGVFADPAAFAGLIGPWLATAANREEAFAVIPAAPDAWAKLQQIYAQETDWPGYCAARERWDLALQAHLTSQLAQAEEQRAAAGARELFLEVAAEARSGRRYLGLLTRALEGCPPGSVDHRTAQRLSQHLIWSLERCRLDRCPLSPRALRRLAGFCRDLDPLIDAMAALVTGDLPRAEVLERTYATIESDDWAAYRLLKAKQLAERERGADVEAALAGIPRSWSDRPSYWQVRALAARAAADTAGEAAAARELANLAVRAWPATAWYFHGGVPQLELLAAGGAPGLELAIDAAPPHGAAAEVRFDESILGTFPVAAGTTLSLRVPVAPGLHLLELEAVAGGTVVPGAVRLAGPAGGAPGPDAARGALGGGGAGGAGTAAEGSAGNGGHAGQPR